MEDGNAATIDTTKPAELSAPPAISEDAIAQKVFDRFQAGMQRAQTPDQRSNALVTAYNALKEAEVHPDIIAANLKALSALRTEMDETRTAREIERERRIVGSDAHRFISRCIREYSKEDPRIGEIESTIRTRVVDKFNANPNNKAELDAGSVNENVLEALVDEIVSDLSKRVLGIDKAKSGSTVKSKASSTAKGDESKPGEGTAEVRNEDELADYQQEFFYSHEAFLRQYKGKSKADAAKEAFEMAKNLPKPNLRTR